MKAILRYVPVSRTIMLTCLLAVGAAEEIANSSPAHAQALNATGYFLYYVNFGPSVVYGPNSGGEDIAYGADSVVPNGNAGTVGFATTTGFSTSIPFDPGPADPNTFFGTTSYSSLNSSQLSAPWTITFENPVTTPPCVSSNCVSNTLSLFGPGEIPLPINITISPGANPTFNWSSPVSVNGYRVAIIQDDIVSIVSPVNSGLIGGANLTGPPPFTLTPPDCTAGPKYCPLQLGTQYTMLLDITQTRDGSSTNLSNSNTSAAARVFVPFQILPPGAPATVYLPIAAPSGNGVLYKFNMTVQTELTYYIDPEVADGYIYKAGSGNPNFASVELPNIGNPTPYDLYLWNGTSFVFDTQLAAGTVFDFASGGVSEFEVLGIDPNLGIDPTNTTAFITGLTFEGAGSFTGTMTPITTSVPEASTWAMMLLGFAGLGYVGYRGRERAARSALVRQT
jgi:hypothetical protein